MQQVKFWCRLLLLSLSGIIFFLTELAAQPGTPDPAFGGGDGIFTQPFLASGHANASTLAIQPNGRIVVAGSSWVPNQSGSSEIAILRLMPNGSLDPTFNGTGKATVKLANTSIAANKILMLPDGKIMCAGGAWNDTEEWCLLARLNADGTPDTSFDGDGIITYKIGSLSQYFIAMTLQPDGKILTAGYANLSGYKEVVVMRFKPNGSIDNTFGGGLVHKLVGESYSRANDIALQPDGKILVTGFAVVNGSEDFMLLRYNANGSPDNTFSGDGIATASLSNKDDNAIGLALQPNGKIVVTGVANSAPGADVEMAVARFTSTGNLDPTFGGGDGMSTLHVSNNPDYASSLAIQADGKILLAGHTQQLLNSNWLYHTCIARLNTDGTPDTGFGAGDGFSVATLGSSGDFNRAMALQADGKAVLVGNASLSDFQQFAVVRFLTGISVDTNTPEESITAVTLYPNPIQEHTTLRYNLKSTTTVVVKLYDLQGRFIQNLLPPVERAAGQQSEYLVLDQPLPSGTYLLVLETPQEHMVIKAIF